MNIWTKARKIFSAFPTPEHRKWDVSFLHYMTVAVEDFTEEDRIALLDKAVEYQMNSTEFQEYIFHFKASKSEGVKDG